MSTSLKALAKKLPAKYREQLLAGNVIYKAIPTGTDGHMKVLFGIWTTYFDPHGSNDLGCSYCLQNILSSFKELQPEFVALAKEEALIGEP